MIQGIIAGLAMIGATRVVGRRGVSYYVCTDGSNGWECAPQVSSTFVGACKISFPYSSHADMTILRKQQYFSKEVWTETGSDDGRTCRRRRGGEVFTKRPISFNFLPGQNPKW